MATFIENFRRLERLAYLVKRKATGSPKELAEKLGVSERTAHNLLDSLRELSSVEVKFCRERSSYFFDGEVDVCFEIVLKERKDWRIIGGRNYSENFFKTALFLRCRTASLYC